VRREKPVDSGRNFPDLGPKFAKGEKVARTRHVATLRAKALAAVAAGGGARVKQDRDGHTTISTSSGGVGGERVNTVEDEEKELDERLWDDSPENDERDLSWSAVLKRTFEAYVRGERPNMYGEWMVWE
jgi:WD repeat and SOF domain-containing protein 1